MSLDAERHQFNESPSRPEAVQTCFLDMMALNVLLVPSPLPCEILVPLPLNRGGVDGLPHDSTDRAPAHHCQLFWHLA